MGTPGGPIQLAGLPSGRIKMRHVCPQYGFDFTKRNAMPSDLRLVINPA
jgi:hypothetical protein